MEPTGDWPLINDQFPILGPAQAAFTLATPVWQREPTVRGYRATGIQRYRDTGIQGYRDRRQYRIQGYSLYTYSRGLRVSPNLDTSL